MGGNERSSETISIYMLLFGPSQHDTMGFKSTLPEEMKHVLHCPLEERSTGVRRCAC
jgi:hypothetical protein